MVSSHPSLSITSNEIGGIFTIVITHYYMQGQKYGHLASANPKANYRFVIGDPAWTYAVPVDPRAYSLAALAIGNAAAQCKQLVAHHKMLVKNHADYFQVEKAGKELTLYTVGDDALAPLKKQNIGFGNKIVLGIFNHL
jgi:hypothetical protein